MPVKIIACEVMKEELLAVKAACETSFDFISMGLHLRPEKLKVRLQEEIEKTSGFSRIVMGFGLCGGTMKDIKAGNIRLTVPRVHDCLPVLTGCADIYKNKSERVTGTFFTSGGWMEGERSFPGEYRRICTRYGPQKALGVMKTMLDSYSRFMYIRTGHPREESSLRESLNLSAMLGLTHDIRTGNPDFLKRIVNGPWEDSEFINIDPGCSIIEDNFF